MFSLSEWLWYNAQDRMLRANLKRFRRGELTEDELRRELDRLLFGKERRAQKKRRK